MSKKIENIFPSECLLEGIISVSAAVRAKSRKIYRVYIDKNKIKQKDRKVSAFLSLLEENGIKYEVAQRDVIDAFAQGEDGGKSHGGIVAAAGERIYCPLDTLLEDAVKNKGYIVVLDGVEDPFNFGYSVRNLYALGVYGILIPQRNWMSASAVCARSSAGACELAKMALLPDFSSNEEQISFINKLKKMGFSVSSAAFSKGAVNIDEAALPLPNVLFIGGEKRGISQSFVDASDEVVKIPYLNDVKYSLPTASVASIFGYEFARRQKI